MKNNQENPVGFVLAIYRMEQEGTTMVATGWQVRLGFQKLPKNYSIGYVLIPGLPIIAAAWFTPSLPDEVAEKLRSLAERIQRPSEQPELVDPNGRLSSEHPALQRFS